jgi:hypothetical protein
VEERGVTGRNLYVEDSRAGRLEDHSMSRFLVNRHDSVLLPKEQDANTDKHCSLHVGDTTAPAIEHA